MSVAQERKTASINSVFWLLSLSATSFGFFICAFLSWIKLSGAQIPCGKGICAVLDIDPISRPFGIPLAVLGMIYYTGLLALSVRSFAHGSQTGRSLSLVLAGIGSAVGLALVYYAYRKTGAFCPWCTASAVASLITFGALLSIEGWDASQRKGGTFPLVAGGIALASVFAMERSLHGTPLSVARLDQVSASDLIGRNRALDESGLIGKSVVAFVDLGCNTCRIILRDLRSRPRNLFLRFTKPDSIYSSEAAISVLSCRSVGERQFVLQKLLDDDSRTTETVRAAIDKLDIPPDGRKVAEQELAIDTLLEEKLEVASVPVVIEIDGAIKRLIPTSDLVRS